MAVNAVDILVVGGGVNGVAIARDAAGRGLSVWLCEAGDLGGATSSASSKLVHGGLRYLEQYAFRLVRESLIERETLLRTAPHIVWPMRFVLPHHRGLRPAFMLRAGLFLYDALAAGRSLPAARSLDLRRGTIAAALKPAYRRGFGYSDCWVDDARLVALGAVGARAKGAKVLTRTKLVAVRADREASIATLERADGGRLEVRARALVNAAGPWVGEVLRTAGARSANRTPRLVKGSHIVVPRVHEGPEAFTFQNGDGRIIFVLPFERRFSLIGTTDIPYTDDPRKVEANEEEIAYLCTAVNAYLAREISPRDVVWTYAGVRPLYDDGSADASAVTRDYVFHLEGDAEAPLLLSIFGGKLTTHRKLAEHALGDLARHMPITGAPWTSREPLPGGEMPDGFDAFLADAARRYPWLAGERLLRLARAYGARIDMVLAGASGPSGLGRDFGAGLTEQEIHYLMQEEWAETAEDVLWRRSKLGLHLGADARAAAAEFIAGASRG
jgi:glycerol-3-phosphate dehydrogenase